MKAPWSRNREAATGDRSLLISIQPRYANAILDGSKTVELRRTMPTLEPGATAVIYSSSPTKAVVGWATVEEIVRATPPMLWKAHQASTGVTADEFEQYFSGRSDAFGLRLTNVERAPHAMGLDRLRAHGVQPPQSWRYLSASLTRTLCDEMGRREASLWRPWALTTSVGVRNLASSPELASRPVRP